MKNIFLSLFLLVIVFTPSGGQAGSLRVDDHVVINFEVRGSGQPLVLLHSGMMSREDMRVQIDHFSQKFMVIAVDGREQGRSSSSPSQISYELMAGDVIAVLDKLGVDKTNLFGQSDGGITALLLACYHPERVIKAAIHGAVYNHSAYPDSQKERWKNITFDEGSSDDTNPDGFPGMAIRHYLLGRKDLTGFEAHLQEMANMWATSPNLSKEELSHINVPMLVIVGDHYDISIPHTVEMHEALPNSELFIVPGATHFVHEEKPDLLHKVIDEFLTRK